MGEYIKFFPSKNKGSSAILFENFLSQDLALCLSKSLSLDEHSLRWFLAITGELSVSCRYLGNPYDLLHLVVTGATLDDCQKTSSSIDFLLVQKTILTPMILPVTSNCSFDNLASSLGPPFITTSYLDLLSTSTRPKLTKLAPGFSLIHSF